MEAITNLIDRAIRHVTPRMSKERYFSPAIWNTKWSGGYDLNLAREDGRYGALAALMCRYHSGGSILDAGCGDGLLGTWFRRFSMARIVAFDYSTAAIDIAKARQLPEVEFFCADTRTFKPKERFSIVVLNESLYYMDNYMEVMSTLSGALTESGLFIVSMHSDPITKRIWKNLERSYVVLDGIMLKHEPTGGIWHLRVLGLQRY